MKGLVISGIGTPISSCQGNTRNQKLRSLARVEPMIPINLFTKHLGCPCVIIAHQALNNGNMVLRVLIKLKNLGNPVNPAAERVGRLDK